MHLYAALVPPREVLDHLHDVVEKVRPAREPSAAATPGRHLGESRSRVFGRRHPAPEPVAAGPPPLDWVDPDHMQLPIAKFGNLTLDEAAVLAHTVQREAVGWPAPRLRLAGGVALDWPGDQSAWVGLAGDVDALMDIAHAVVRVAQGLQLFVDRRTFRPCLKLGTINAHTTAPYLEELVATLNGYEGPPWSQTDVKLLVPADPVAGQPPYRPFRDAPLGPEPAR